jgi:hypothetical protein
MRAMPDALIVELELMVPHAHVLTRPSHLFAQRRVRCGLAALEQSN